MDTKTIKRLFNPLEMTRALAVEDVGRKEFIFYILLSLMIIVFFIYTGFTSQEAPTFTFPFGGMASSLSDIILTFLVFILPIFITWRKISIADYLKYFLSIYATLSIWFLLTTVVYGLARIVFFGPINMSAISFLDFVFITIILFTTIGSMPYFIRRAVLLYSRR